MVAHALDDGGCTAVAYGKALTGLPCGPKRATGRTVEHGVPDQRAVAGAITRVLRRANDNLAAAKALPDIVVGLTRQAKLHTADRERAKTLSGATTEVQLDRRIGDTDIIPAF